MNKTTHAHRLYMVLALVTGMMLLAVVPAAAGTQTPELDGWANARLAENKTEPVTSQGGVRDDGWGRDGGPRSISATQSQPVSVDGWAVGQGMRSQTQPVPVDGWAVGQGMRSQTAPFSTAGQSPSSTPISLSSIVLGLLIAAVLGAGTAAAVGHRRHVPSAH